MKKQHFYLFLFLAVCMFASCSSDEAPQPQDPPQKEDPAPSESSGVTYVVANDNNLMSSKGKIIAQYNTSSIQNLIDKNNDKYFSVEKPTVWIIWKSDKPVTLENYSLISSPVYVQHDPKSWVLSASTDSLKWVQLDKQENFAFSSRKETRTFEVENAQSYVYFKLDVKSNNGGDRVLIGGWGINNEIVLSMDDLMKYASGYTKSSQTPMGKHYENRHVATESDKAWLLDPNNEPPVPPGLDDGTRSYKYFKVNLYPFGKPMPADINQRGIGDCGAHAAMGSLVYSYPDFVKTLITEGPNETFVVNMFDPQGNPIQVAVSSKFLADGNGNIMAGTGKNAVPSWSSVLEKSIKKYNAIFKVNTNIEGIGSEHVLPLFTGNGESFAFNPNALKKEDLKRAVEVALKQGKLIIGGFNTKDIAVTRDGQTAYTFTNHAWTLVHSTQAGVMFGMRNPWGFNNGHDRKWDGVLDIPPQDYIAKTIDLRIVEPGKAGLKGNFAPYVPPVIAFGLDKLWVSDRVMNRTF